MGAAAKRATAKKRVVELVETTLFEEAEAKAELRT